MEPHDLVSELAWFFISNSVISSKADVVLKFLDEDAPSTVQSKNLYVPKPEIKVSVGLIIRSKRIMYTISASVSGGIAANPVKMNELTEGCCLVGIHLC